MVNFMIKHWLNFLILLVFILINNLSIVYAQEFEKFSITPKLKRLTQLTDIQDISLYNQDKENELFFLLTPEKLRTRQIFNVNEVNLSQFPWDRIIKILTPFLLSNGQNRTLNAFNDLPKLEHQFGGNIKNFGTIEWQEPLGFISFHVRRELNEVATSKIEVNDVLEIIINAETYLKHLSKENLVQISNEQLSAFANIKYHKIFNYKHYKNSLEEAQKADYATLLFPFKFFNFPYLLKLKKEEEISHKDFLSLNVEGSASANFATYIKAGISIRATIENKQATVIKISKDAQYDDIYQMKKSVGTKTNLGIEAGVALDFLKLLDLTLLKISYDYQYEKEKSTYYHAPLLDKIDISSIQMDKKNFWVGEETFTSKAVTIDSSFLLWGTSHRTEQQFTQIKNSTEEENIQEEWWAKETHVHSLFGGIISDFLGDLVGSFLGFSKKFSSQQEFIFEENSKENEFHLEFSRSMYLDNRSSIWSFTKKKLMKNFIDNHNLIPEDVKELWTKNWFHKNIYIKDEYSFSSKILSHFQWLGPYEFQVSSIYLCNLSMHPAIDLNSYENLINFKKLNWKQKNCLKNSYEKLMQTTNARTKNDKIHSFLKYLKYFLKHSSDNMALYVLFPKNLLSHQTILMAKNKSNEKFKGSYTRGHNKPLKLYHEFLDRLSLWR